jgi:hypothetical protein
MSLFRTEGFDVVVDPELRVINEFRLLIAEDKNRDKKNALLWFAYIYHMYDYKSPYQLYDHKERHVRVCKDLNLPADFSPSKRHEGAIEKYKELRTTPAVKTLITTRQALTSAEKAIYALTQKIEMLLVDNEEEERDTVAEAVKSVTKLLEIAERLPKMADIIANLEDKVKKEQSGESRLRGGGKKGMFED